VNFTREYQDKLRTPEVAVKAVRSGDWVDYGFATNQPMVLDDALAKRKLELKDIKIRSALSLRPRQVVGVDPEREVFTFCSWHFSGYDRQLHDRNLCNFIPMIYRNMPLYYRNDLVVNVAMISVAPMDKHGYFNLSLATSATRAIIETAKIVIVEVNDQFPQALGGREECIHISEVDFIVESGNVGIPELPVDPSDDIDKQVARLIVEDVVNGSILQLGIGGMPNAVGNMIAESNVKDLGMHTEMLVDAYLAIFKKGKLTNKYKNIDKGKCVWTFSAGTRELYDWVDQNHFLAAYPVEYTNNPAVIGQFDNFISVNSCVEVDLFGQISSESSGVRQISGTGGQLDFVTGAYQSKGGKSFICFRSSFYNKKTNTINSCVVPTLATGGIVTDPRTQAHYLVNEWGKVKLAGCSTWERAERIISIAHPDFREELIRKAEQMKIWRRSNKK